jgi:hypothetical protein
MLADWAKGVADSSSYQPRNPLRHGHPAYYRLFDFYAANPETLRDAIPELWQEVDQRIRYEVYDAEPKSGRWWEDREMREVVGMYLEHLTIHPEFPEGGDPTTHPFRGGRPTGNWTRISTIMQGIQQLTESQPEAAAEFLARYKAAVEGKDIKDLEDRLSEARPRAPRAAPSGTSERPSNVRGPPTKAEREPSWRHRLAGLASAAFGKPPARD